MSIYVNYQQKNDSFMNQYQGVQQYREKSIETLINIFEKKLNNFNKEEFRKKLNESPYFISSISDFLSKNGNYRILDISIDHIKECDVPEIKKELQGCWEILLRQIFHSYENDFHQGVREHPLFKEKVERYSNKLIQFSQESFFNDKLSLSIVVESLFLGADTQFSYLKSEIRYIDNSRLLNMKSPRELEAYQKIQFKIVNKKKKKIFHSALEKEKKQNIFFDQKIKILLYNFVSKKLGIDINDLTYDDVKNVEGDFYKLLEIVNNTIQEEKREKYINELIKEEENNQLTAATPSKKERKTKKNFKITKRKQLDFCSKKDNKEEPFIPLETSAATNEIDPLISRLNRPGRETRFRLHPRVSRWREPNLDLIKRFGPSYSQCDVESLRNLRNCHYLFGIERLLSEQEVISRYSFSYAINNRYEAQGRGFYATMETAGNSQQTGIIYVAFNEKTQIIYHAMFEPYTKYQTFSLQEFKEKSEEIGKVVEEGSELSGFEWENSQETTFSFNEDGFIVMEVGRKSKNRVTFIFESLSLVQEMG